jgi:hypothetical protein
VERRGIEVRSVGPHEGVSLWIQPDFSEQVRISTRPYEWSLPPTFS